MPIVWLMGFGCLPEVAFGQLKVDDKISIEAAIAKLVGPGVRVTSVRIDCPSGKKRPFGYFTDNTGSLGLSDGLVLTTGAATNAIGPNNSGSMSQKNNNNNQDDDLRSIIQNNEKQYDACVMEFNVEVFADTLVFDYVFGSEEYLEFIKDYHDVFGFFISGPGISGTVNLALVPGTNRPVSVKNINNATNSQYYIDNGTGSTPFDNLFVQYDGFTKKLESKIAVIPCQMYTLKLAICDIKDDIYDAGIFIGGKSLRTKAPILSLRQQYSKFRTAIEGCNGVFVTLTRQSLVENAASYFLEYAGSATPGIDYGDVPFQLDFLPGEKSKEFFIPILADNIPDDGEEILVSVKNPCPGLPQIDALTIPIKESFEFDVPDAQICLGDSVQLNANPADGYSYSWSPNQFLSCSNCPSPSWYSNSNQSYLVTCREMESGCLATDSMNVEVKPVPVANFTFESKPDYTNLDVFFTNTSQYSDSWSWTFGDGTGSLEFNPTHYYSSGFARDTVEFPVLLVAKNSALTCSDTATTYIRIGNPFFIPNLITANGDGKNDAFFIRGIQPGRWNLEIFNRWGKSVFQTNNYELNWSGSDVNSGLYYFILENQKGDRRYSGWIDVLK